MQNMATFNYSETACPHISNSFLQSVSSVHLLRTTPNLLRINKKILLLVGPTVTRLVTRRANRLYMIKFLLKKDKNTCEH